MPTIAPTKFVSRGVITRPYICFHAITSFSGTKKNPGLNSVYPTVTDTSGKNTATTFGNTTIENIAVNAIILLVH